MSLEYAQAPEKWMSLVVQIRCSLTPDQREMLNAIWSNYRVEGRWLPRRLLHHRFLNRVAPNDVRAALERLGGRVVYDFRDNQRDCYALTFLGILVTDEGPNLEEFCLRYLEYLRDLYINEPHIEQVTSQKVESALQIPFEDAQLLGTLVSFGHLYGSSMSGPGPQGWGAGLPDDVDTLPGHPDLRAHLHREALRDYEQGVPIDENGRASYYLRKTGVSRCHWPDLEHTLTADLPADPLYVPEHDRLYVDEIDSFEKVKAVSAESAARFLMKGCLRMPEREVKRAIGEILEVACHRSDWGGELNDLSTANVVVSGRRRNAAFLLKGPAIGRREMTIADCGKNGDQIVRLVSMAHDLFVVQSTGPIADAVVQDVQSKVDALHAHGRRAQYVIMDGQDTARLLYAYGKLR
jgi:hypothetical protein